MPILISSQSMSEESLGVTSSEDFIIDGKGTASQWGVTDWFYLDPLNADKAYTTRLKMLYSETGMYFLFMCEDLKIISTFKEDFSNLWKEDVVEVFLWTDENYPMYFEYELSPNNYELPIFIPKVGENFTPWRPWHYEGDRRTRHMTDIQMKDGKTVGWTAEFFIPYQLLSPLNKVPPKPGTKWRANMYRIDYDKEKSVWWSWKPIVKNFHDHELFGTIEFQ